MPGTRLTIWYWPIPSLTAERTFSISAGLAASTVTPGRTAPDVSFTVPTMLAWAYAVAGIDEMKRIQQDNRESFASTRISALLVSGRTSRVTTCRRADERPNDTSGNQ